MNSVSVFEDSAYQNFLPLAYNRPVYELRSGIYSMLGRITLQYPDTEINLFCREYLKNILAESYPHSVNGIKSNTKGCLFINGRLLMSTPIDISGKEEIGICDNTIVYARLLKKDSLSITPEKFLDNEFVSELKKKFQVKKISAKLIEYPWDLIRINKDQITSDFTSHIKSETVQKTDMREYTLLWTLE